MTIRSVKRQTAAKPVIEGAGVHLYRAFGFGDTEETDPFLLLDDFRNTSPERYEKGFPFHPHRGMETITYVLRGRVEHQDSLGNKGVIGAGDVQWMTAGSGIIHQEMPEGDDDGHMGGFQLWANLPAEHKLTKPRYQEVKADEVPVVEDGGSSVRVVCGSYLDQRGPIEGIAASPTYLDISMPAGAGKSFPVEAGRNAFAYVFEGAGSFGEALSSKQAGNRTLVVFGDGDEVTVHAGEEGIRFLLVSGRPIAEPVAWRGPIVMNTDAELRQAFKELEQGTFLERNER
jgi:hypothetical protein